MAPRGFTGSQAAQGLGWLLRAKHDGLLREPLPDKWVELINCLDDKKRERLIGELTLDKDDVTDLKC